MPASVIHLVRHGEVFNPDGILYGRLPGFHLSALGQQMASAAAGQLAGRPIAKLYASPLLRAQESARPWAARFSLEIDTDDRLIEPTNKFEGKTFEFGPGVLLKPAIWPWVFNPLRPSWGEPYNSVIRRMLSAIDDAWASVDSGEIVMVSHQMPIVMVQRALAGKKPWHDPRNRRCNLSSITSFERSGATFREISYQDPGADLLNAAVDNGAV